MLFSCFRVFFSREAEITQHILPPLAFCSSILVDFFPSFSFLIPQRVPFFAVLSVPFWLPTGFLLYPQALEEKALRK